MALPPFIDPLGLPDGQQIPWPYAFKMQSQWYLLPANKKILQEVCDTWLGLDKTKVRYENVLNQAILTVNNYTYLHPEDLPYSARGFLQAKEIALCVMAAKFEDGNPLPSGVTLFTPLIFIDNPMAAVTGLAVFGFPKQVSQIEIQPDVKNPSPTNLSTWVFPTLSPTSQLVVQKVLSITANAGDDTVQGFPSYNSEVQYVFDRHKKSDLDPAVAKRIDSLFSGADGLLTLTTLKQFRDAEEPSQACYQAIVESKMKDLKNFTGDLLKGTYDVSLFPSGSLPISKVLGTGALNQVGGFWFDVQLSFGYAENILINAG